MEPIEDHFTDFLRFVAAVQRVHASSQVPDIESLVTYALGKSASDQCSQIESRAISDKFFRARLFESLQIVGDLNSAQLSVVTPIENPFHFEIAQAWQKQTSQTLQVPVDETPFIGRSSEVRQLKDWLSISAKRLMVIIGAGGVGKTFLLNQMAMEARSSFPNCVFQVECSSLADSGEVLNALAATAGIEDASDPFSAIVEKLAGTPGVVLLDKIDNLYGLGSELDRLLTALPDLRILATSRLPFDQDFASELQLQPFDLTSDEQGEVDAVNLFSRMAERCLSSFKLTASNMGLVKELCRLTRGVPLSISIAAGCINTQPLPDIVRSYNLNAATSAASPDKSVQSAVAHSFFLMSERQRKTLHLLCIFADSFRYEDAQLVLGVSDEELSQSLSDLQRCSLVRAETKDGLVSYRLHDTVVEYVDSLKISDFERQQHDLALERYVDLFAGRAERVGDLMKVGHWDAGIRLLREYNPNLRKAMRHVVAENDAVKIRTFADGLARTYFETGYLSDFEYMSAAASRLGQADLTIRMLGLQGALASIRADDATCRELWLQRLELSKSLNDIVSWADCLIDLSWQSFEQGNLAEALGYLVEAEKLSTEADLAELLATAQVIRAEMLISSGSSLEGEEWISQTVQTLDRCHDKSQLPFIYQSLAKCYSALGKSDDAIVTLRKLLVLAAEGQRALHVARTLSRLAPLYESQGQNDIALQCYASAIVVLNEYKTKDLKKIQVELDEFCEKHGIEKEGPLMKAMNEPYEAIVKSLSS